MNRVLIIEDDEEISLIERDYLEINDYQVSICKDGVSGYNEALRNSYDLILLDVMLPGMDGFTLCKKLRQSTDIPILIVTARKQDSDQILGLGLGANDYILKPFEPNLLVARVKANIAAYQRTKPQQETETSNEESLCRSIGPFTICLEERRIFLDDVEMALKNKEFELLIYFMEHKGIVLTKDVLYDKIWGMDSIGDTATVSVHVHRLRDKIKKINPDYEFIKTLWGVGYKFVI